MKRKKLTRHEKFERWESGFLKPSALLTGDEVMGRLRLAYLQGYDSGARAVRAKSNRPPLKAHDEQ